MPKKYKRITKGKYDRKKICQYSFIKVDGDIVIGELKREWDSATQIEMELGFDKSAILRCCKGTQKKSYWYIWKFKEDEPKAPKESKNKELKATIKELQKSEKSI